MNFMFSISNKGTEIAKDIEVKANGIREDIRNLQWLHMLLIRKEIRTVYKLSLSLFL